MTLLDTHIWVRWLVPVHPLPAALVQRIEDADRVAVSAVSWWEVGMLVSHRRIDLPLPLSEWIGEATVGSTLISLDDGVPAYFLGSEGCGKFVPA